MQVGRWGGQASIYRGNCPPPRSSQCSYVPEENRYPETQARAKKTDIVVEKPSRGNTEEEDCDAVAGAGGCEGTIFSGGRTLDRRLSSRVPARPGRPNGERSMMLASPEMTTLLDHSHAYTPIGYVGTMVLASPFSQHET